MGALAHAWSRRETLTEPFRGSFYSGLLGVAYARLEAGELFKDEGLVGTALAAVESLLRSPVGPEALDVISGSAGAIPVLLEIHRRHPRDWLVELALRHAENLLATARKNDEGWSWSNPGITARDHLTGYSHGASGMASALLEINRIVPDRRFVTGAENAFRYERKWFDPIQRNWADLRALGPAPIRSDLPPSCSIAWCHGAPGIALSRLRAYELLGEASWRSEAETAVETTALSLEQMLASEHGNFSLCHGHSGNAEALLYAAQILDASKLSLAQAVGRAGIARFEQADRPWPCGVPNAGETPGLMLGWAGIGYFCLRLDDPINTPSILILRSSADSGK
jgi:lantibiotic modifying enzyme